MTKYIKFIAFALIGYFVLSASECKKATESDPAVEFNLPASYSLVEDSPQTTLDTNLIKYVDNSDNPVLSIVSQSNLSLVTAFLNNAYDLIAKDLEPDGNGESKVKVRVTDGDQIVEKETTLYVDPVNDAPEFNGPIPDYTITQGGMLRIPLSYFSDVDGDNLTYTSENVRAATAIQNNSFLITSYTTPVIILLCFTHATDTQKTGSRKAKLFVPSSGSIIQVYSQFVFLYLFSSAKML